MWTNGWIIFPEIADLEPEAMAPKLASLPSPVESISLAQWGVLLADNLASEWNAPLVVANAAMLHRAPEIVTNPKVGLTGHLREATEQSWIGTLAILYGLPERSFYDTRIDDAENSLCDGPPITPWSQKQAENRLLEAIQPLRRRKYTGDRALCAWEERQPYDPRAAAPNINNE